MIQKKNIIMHKLKKMVREGKNKSKSLKAEKVKFNQFNSMMIIISCGDAISGADMFQNSIELHLLRPCNALEDQINVSIPIEIP